MLIHTCTSVVFIVNWGRRVRAKVPCLTRFLFTGSYNLQKTFLLVHSHPLDNHDWEQGNHPKVEMNLQSQFTYPFSASAVFVQWYPTSQGDVAASHGAVQKVKMLVESSIQLREMRLCKKKFTRDQKLIAVDIPVHV